MVAFWSSDAAAPVVVPFAGFLAFVAVFRGPLTNAVFTNAWITTIGGMCYSIYLLHFALIATLGKVLLGRVPSTGAVWRDVLIQGPLLLILALAGSMIFFLAIELPCMDKRWPRRMVAGARSLLRPATAG